MSQVDCLPDREIEPRATGQVVHGVVGPEVAHVGHQCQDGNHHHQAQKIDPRVFQKPAHTQAKVKRILLENQRPNRQRQQIAQVARQAPVDPPVEILVQPDLESLGMSCLVPPEDGCDVCLEELQAAEVVDKDETERAQHQSRWCARVKPTFPILALGQRRGIEGRPGVAKEPDYDRRKAGQQDNRDHELAERTVENIHPCGGWLSRISCFPTTIWEP